jgi:uncharacterized protein (TIGR03084 family)
MADIGSLLADLLEEGDELVALLRGLPDQDWQRPTPAPGWDVSAQVVHLALVEERAVTSLTDRPTFLAVRARDLSEALLTTETETRRQLPSRDVLGAFLDTRARFAAEVGAADPATRITWYGPDMSLASMITARLMETWAHGQDIRDEFGVPPLASQRLHHIARLGVATRAFSFANRGLAAPAEPVRVSLEAPDGDGWDFGDMDAQHSVVGSALDFCLVVTQRRHVTDTTLEATSGPAAEWLAIAQAFAGPPGEGRQSGKHAGLLRAGRRGSREQ